MKHPRILIVEDQREVTRLLKASLETINSSFEISDCLSGEEAMVLPKNSELDLLIADIGLPGMSGFELMQWFKNINPTVKVILISGVTDPKIRSQVAAAGADAFFFKPIDIPEFLDSSERCLNLIPSILPSEMDLERVRVEEEETGEHLIGEKSTTPATSDLMQSLFEKLSAFGVYLGGDDGKILVRIGKFPDQVNEAELLPLLTTTFISNVRINEVLRVKENHSLFSFSNASFGAIMEPIGEAYYLLVFTKPFVSSSLGLISNETSKTATLISNHLSKVGISTKERVDEIPLAEIVEDKSDNNLDNTKLSEDDDLSEIFSNLDQIGQSAVDNFWEKNEVEVSSTKISDVKSLSYEEAKELGVAPAENVFSGDDKNL